MTKEEYFYSETNKHIRNVQALMGEAIIHLVSQARLHDVSKFDDEEKNLFTEVIPELGKCVYNGEEYKATLSKIKPAVEHHNQYNRHHPEYYPQGIKGMNLVCLIEMLCDWIAATKRNLDGDVIRSIEINQKRFGYSDDVKEILINTARSFKHIESILEEHHKWVEE